MNPAGQACSPVQCDLKQKTYNVTKGNKTVTCAKGDTTKEVEGYTGNLTCTPYERVCTGTIFFNNFYECVFNESLPIDFILAQRLTIRYIMLAFLIILLYS